MYLIFRKYFRGGFSLTFELGQFIGISIGYKYNTGVIYNQHSLCLLILCFAITINHRKDKFIIH